MVGNNGTGKSGIGEENWWKQINSETYINRYKISFSCIFTKSVNIISILNMSKGKLQMNNKSVRRVYK